MSIRYVGMPERQLMKTGSTDMHEIICPHCNKAFKIDEAGYADILKQVPDGAFEQQLHGRLELAEQDKRNAVELVQAHAQVSSEMQKTAVAKDSTKVTRGARLDLPGKSACSPQGALASSYQFRIGSKHEFR